MPKSKRKKYLSFVLALYLFPTLLYSLSVPLWEAPDEPSHYLYIRRISDGKGFRPPRPTGKMDSVWSERYIYSLYQRSQPPLYYITAAPVMKILAARVLPLGDQIAYARVRPDFSGRGNLFIHARKNLWSIRSDELRGHLLRLFSVLLGAITVCFIFQTALLVVPRSPQLALAGAGFAATLPQFNFVTGVIGNDSLAALMGAATLFFLVRLARKDRPGQRGEFFGLGILLSLALLTKFNLLFLLPVSLVVVILKARDAGSGKTGLTLCFLTFLPPLLLAVAGILFLGPETLLKMKILFHRLFSTRAELLTTTHLRIMLLYIYRSFWAVFGWMSIPAGRWLYLIWTALVGAGLGGWLKFALRRRRPEPAARRLFGLLGLSFFFLLLGVLKNNLFVPQSQGRFLFPALGSISILLAFGFLNLFPEKQGEKAVLLLLAVMVILNLVAFLAYLLPASYP